MKVIRYLFLLLFALSVPLIAGAQSDDLIAFNNGDLFTWSLSNNVPEQITFWGYNGGAVLSPDGTTVAFTSYDGTVGDAIAAGDMYIEFGDLPANVWLMDVATQEFQWVNDQSGAVDGGIYRSYPVWSPDGTRLAWTELNGYPNASIKMYDLTTGNISTVYDNFDLGYQDAGLFLPRLKWGDGGISRIVFNIVGENFESVNILEIYDPDTGDLFTMNLDFLDPDGSAFISHHWVNVDGREQVGLQVDSNWGLVDPETKAYRPLDIPPVLQKVGDSSLQLLPVYSGSYSFEWYAKDGNTVAPIGYSDFTIDAANLPTIAPTGNIVAWNGRDGVYIWDTSSQRTQKIIEGDETMYYGNPGPINVVWSPMEWVLSDTPIAIAVRPTSAPTIAPPTQAPQPTQAPVVSSDCKLQARLVPGEYAVLSPGQNNNVRYSWSANSEFFGEIFPGEIVYVHDGPVCNEGYNWYLVSNEFIYGWTAEGYNGQYWLTANIDFTNCWNSPPARLTPGSKGSVLPGSPNRIRAQPGIGNSAVLGEIPGGGQFSVDGFPVCGDDGRRWYPVTYNGISGWTAEGEGNTYWVQPG